LASSFEAAAKGGCLSEKGERGFVKSTGVRAFLLVAGAAALIMATGAPGASTAAGTPRAVTPAAGKRVQSLPFFGWTAVRGADHYEFELAADSGFNSPVLGSAGQFTTKNTRATVSKTLPNGTYWWRVRAITASGSVGPWSAARKLVKAWRAAPNLLAPTNGSKVAYPSPLVFSWAPVAGAATYLVSLATDAGLGSLVGSQPIETSALSLAPAVALHVGTYYWAVTPVDAEGNRGIRSVVRSFQWAWPSVPTNLHVQDLVGPNDANDPAFGPTPFDTALFLPQFSWTVVPGATRYELEINSDDSWATGSRVCCDDKILAPTFTPTKTFLSNRYFWRVRAFDADGNAGAWAPAGNGGTTNSFVKTFDNVCTDELPDNCVPAPGPSIRDLRVEDWSGAVVTGGSTSSPVIIWSPVPGASSYEYEVTRYHDGGCDFTWSKGDHWHAFTSTAAWTPMGPALSRAPYPGSVTVDNKSLVAGAQYCVRVRAQTDRDAHGNAVFGDFTSIPSGTSTPGVAFTYSGGTGGVVSSLAPGDYLTPAQGTSLRQMPFFRWRPVIGAQGYWILVSKDPSFTNVVDYAYTVSPTYAPRTSSGVTTYPDESTTYYWAVLPNLGARTSGDPAGAVHGTFQKEVPPAELRVALDQPQPVFRWKPVAGARNYELEVSSDPNFGSIVEKAATPSTSYTAAVTYPPGKKLYWHVRADDEKKIGLSWASSSFEYRLPAPSLAGNARSGDTIPTWRWKPVLGATSYDLHADLPNGTHSDFSGLRTAAFTATKMTGTGIFHWQVRANFPNSSGTTHGPYSRPVAYARTIKPPTGAHAVGGGTSIALVWRPKVGAKQYKVQIATKPDFSSTVEQVTTDNPTFAPLLSSFNYLHGGVYYWRVAAVDANGNSGDYTKTHTFRLRKTGK
jgi:hypothetical protein